MKSITRSPSSLRVLHLEDSLADAELIRGVLTSEWNDCQIARVDAGDEFKAALFREPFDLILSDFSMPGFNGLSALKIARHYAPQIPFVFLSGTIGEENAVESLKMGATDYVIKDRMARLIPVIRRALNEVEEQAARRQAEERLREQAELLDKARDAIVVTDMERRIIYWNKGAEEIFGWTAAEAIGRLGRDLFGADAVHEFKAIPIGGATDEWHGDVNVHNKNGQARTLQYSVTIIRDEAGQPKSRLIISTDITSQKEMEKKFLRAQRLESLGMLAAGIAHDLNNVLAPVLMGAPLLRFRAEHPADIRVIETIEKSAERGAALVRQILSFAHGTGGAKVVIQIKHLIRDISDLIKETFPKMIKLEVDVASDLWTVEGNSTQIHQILLNLSVNARDAMPNGGKLTLRATNTVLDVAAAAAIPNAAPGSFVELQVADDGTGIPPEVLARIWEPFFTTKSEGKGTGLGLATVRGIATNHGGFAHVVTAPGQGTVFHVYLPSAEIDSPDHAQFSTAPFLSRGEGELVLVVDDENSISDLVQAVLTRNGYRVLVASSAAEAIPLYASRATEFVLVISDMNMPGMGGLELARGICRLRPEQKILFMSGANDDLPAEFAGRPGWGIKKPFTVDELLHRVRQRIDAPPVSAAGPLDFV